MQQYSKSVGSKGASGFRQSISTWNIYIPSDVDREQFVQQCYRTGTVSLINENLEQVNRIAVGKIAMQYLYFPDKSGEQGSTVVCGNIAYRNQLVVLDVLPMPEEYGGIGEKESRVTQSSKGALAEITTQGKTGNINIHAHSNTDAGGEINISATNKGQTAKVKVQVAGSTEVYNSGEISMGSEHAIILTVTDGEDEATVISVDKDQVLINGREKVVLGEEKEPVLLGQTTIDLLAEILDALVKSKAGPYILSEIATFTQLKEKLDSLLSQYSFTK